MDRFAAEHVGIKKPVKPTARPFTPALLFLRALQLGLTYTEAFYMDVGFIHNLLIEKSNDGYDYPLIGTTADFRKL